MWNIFIHFKTPTSSPQPAFPFPTPLSLASHPISSTKKRAFLSKMPPEGIYIIEKRQNTFATPNGKWWKTQISWVSCVWSFLPSLNTNQRKWRKNAPRMHMQMPNATSLEIKPVLSSLPLENATPTTKKCVSKQKEEEKHEDTMTSHHIPRHLSWIRWISMLSLTHTRRWTLSLSLSGRNQDLECIDSTPETRVLAVEVFVSLLQVCDVFCGFSEYSRLFRVS